jgi:ATP-binding cassette subfamily F protein 3
MISINHSQYLELRHEIRENNGAQKNQAKKIEETEKLIENFGAKSFWQQSMIKWIK